MKRSQLKKALNAELVEEYEKAATEQRRASDHRLANQQWAILAACYRELRERGLEAQRCLLPLLKTSDDGVRLWVAAHATEFEPEIAEKVLVEIASKGGQFSFNAKQTLEVWRKEGLRFP